MLVRSGDAPGPPGVRRLSSRLLFGVTASRVFVRASGFSTIRRTVQLTPRLSGRWRVTWVVERADFFRGEDARVGVAKRSALLVRTGLALRRLQLEPGVWCRLV